MIRRARRRTVAAAGAVALLATACGSAGATPSDHEEAEASAAPGSGVEMVAAGATPPNWAYEGVGGPKDWGLMAEDWRSCAEGHAQSPIDITDGRPADGSPDAPGAVVVDYHPSAYEVTDNGHTVQVNLADAGTLSLDGTPYTLVQFHFHTPSEHTVSGAAYPMEYHLVHRSADGGLAVLGVFVQWGTEHRALAPILEHLPAAGETVAGETALDPAALLPENRSMVRYDGSLTTPPCSESVKWHVLLAPVQLSRAQTATFALSHPGSARPTQELHGRLPVVAVDTSTVEGAVS